MLMSVMYTTLSNIFILKHSPIGFRCMAAILWLDAEINLARKTLSESYMGRLQTWI